MRKLLIIVLVLLVLLVSVVPVFAHNEGPCNDNGEPGNSDYAQHHIVPATLGHDAHIPGTHQGFSACLGVHP